MALAEKQAPRPWNMIESPEINPHVYKQIIPDEEAKSVQWRKESLFNKWYFLENLKATCRRIKLSCYLSSYTKINAKWI